MKAGHVAQQDTKHKNLVIALTQRDKRHIGGNTNGDETGMNKVYK